MGFRGMAYDPSPSDALPGAYLLGGDWYDCEFGGLWSDAAGGRADLRRMSDMGVNTVRPGSWNASATAC